MASLHLFFEHSRGEIFVLILDQNFCSYSLCVVLFVLFFKHPQGQPKIIFSAPLLAHMLLNFLSPLFHAEQLKVLSWTDTGCLGRTGWESEEEK